MSRAGEFEWKKEGVCRGLNPDIFFPETFAGLKVAKALCAVCPVRRECLEYALVNGLDHGIWGGISERERRRIRSRRRRGPA